MKLIKTLAAVTLVAIALTGCSALNISSMKEEKPVTDEGDHYATLGILSDAETIRLEKDAISWGDHWSVKVNDTEVAEINGEPIYTIGDTYSLYTASGNFMGAEAEQYRVVNSSAKLYDYNVEETGSIDQSFSFFLYSFQLKNAAGETVGSMEQNFSFNFTADIKNPDGSVAYKIDRDFFSIGDKVTLTAVDPQNVPVTQAIWMAVIANEIYVAAQEKNDDN